MNSGTPKDLDQTLAIILALPENPAKGHLAYLVMRDFLAQRFGVAYLEADGRELESLMRVFDAITKRA